MASNGNNLVKDTIDKFTGLSTNNTVLIQSASTVFTERETGALVKGSLRIRVLQATDIPTETTSHTVTSAWIKNPLRKQHSGKTKHEVKLNAICIIGCTSEGPVFATESMPLNDNIFWNEEFAVDNVTMSDELKLFVIDRGKNDPYCSLSLKDDFTTRHGFIGKVSVPLIRLPEGEEIEQWYPLVPKESYLSLKTALRVMLCFVPQGDSRLESKMARARTRTLPSFDTTGRLRNSLSSPTNSLQTPNPQSVHLPTGIIEYVIVAGSQFTATGSGETTHKLPENTILFRYPETDRPDFPLPTKIEWFCFPGGPEIIQQKKRPQSRIFSFVLCGGRDGLCRSYGVCLIIYHQEKNEKKSENFFISPPTTTWISSCICMISRLPLIDEITGCLMSVAYLWLVAAAGPACSNLNQNQFMNKPEDYIMQLCHGIPLPIRGIMGVEFEIAKLPILLVLPNIYPNNGMTGFGHQRSSLSSPLRSPSTAFFGPASLSIEYGFQPLVYSLEPVFRIFDIKTVIQLVALILCEYRILIHSTQMSLLCPIAEGLCTLIYPFRWQHPYVPILPRVLSEYLQAPLPYILGVHSSWLPGLLENGKPEHLVLVDLDRGAIEMQEGGPILPLKFTRGLYKRVKRIIQPEMQEDGYFYRRPKRKLNKRERNRSWTDPTNNSPGRSEPRVRSFHGVSTGSISEEIQKVDAEKDKASNETILRAADRRTASSSTINWKDDSEQRTNSNPNLMVKSHSFVNFLSTDDKNDKNDKNDDDEEEDNLVDSFELLEAWDEEKQRKVRLEFVCFFSAMLIGYRDCLFFVNQKLPVFNKRRFFATCEDQEVIPFLTRLFCSQSFQAFLENHGASDLFVFHTVYSTFARYKHLEWPESMPYMALQGGGGISGNLRSSLYGTNASNVRTPQPPQIQSTNVLTPILNVSLDNGIKKLNKRNTILKKKNSQNPSTSTSSSTSVTTETFVLFSSSIDQLAGTENKAVMMTCPTGDSKANDESMTTNSMNIDMLKIQKPSSIEGSMPGNVRVDYTTSDMKFTMDNLVEKPPVPISEINESSALQPKLEREELNEQAIEDKQKEETLESLGRKFEDLLDIIAPTEIPLLKMNQASNLTTTNLSKYDDYRMVAREMGLDEHVFEDNWDILEKPHTLDFFSPTTASTLAANHNANRNLTKEEEKIEQILHKCLSGIFTSDDSITSDELEKCEMRFKSQYARDLFVLILMQPTHHYADSGGGSASASAWYNPKGSGSCIGESGFTNLVRLSKSLMDQCALHEDFTNARGMLQVAMQYYRLTEEINSGVSLNFGMKEYLQTSLRSRPICHSLDMWQHAFSRDVDAAIIADPAASCDDNNPNNVSDETFFSLIGSLVYDMLTVEVPVGKVHTFVSVMCSTYQKGKEMFDTMKQLVDNVYRALELSKDQPPAKNRSNRVTNSIDGLGNGGPLALKRQTSVMPTAGSTGGNDTTSKSRHYDLDNVIRRKMSVGERNQSPSSKNSSASTVDKEEHLSSPTTTTGILGFNLRTRKKAQSSISSQCVMLCNQNAPILSMITLQNRVVCGISDSTIAVFDTNHPEKKSKLEGHTGPVVAVQLRGNTLISGSRDHTLRVWDMRIATRKRTIMSYVGFSSSNPMVTSNDDIMEIDPAMISKKSLIMKGHTAPVTCVEIGRQLTTERALVASGSEDATIRLWDTTRESSISLLGNGKGSISCLRFIPLGDLLVSGCRKNTLKIWDLASSKMRSNITIHKGALRDIQITGDRLVTASNDRTVKVWDVNFRSGQSYTHSLRDHGGPVLCTSLGGPADPNICTGSTDGIVRVWDLRYVRKGPRLTLKGHLGSVSCIQRDFTKLVSAGEDGNLKVWDMHSGLCLKDIKGHLSGVTCISFRDASIFSASWDGSVRVWDIDGGPIVETTAASIVVSSKNPNVSSSSTTTSAFRNWINPFH